jgi:hypothetical protein
MALQTSKAFLAGYPEDRARSLLLNPDRVWFSAWVSGARNQVRENLVLRLALVVGLSGVIATSAIAQSDASAPAASNGSSAAASTPTDPDYDPNKVICKTVKPPTGTRVGSSRNRQRVCQTRAAWDDQAREAQESLRVRDKGVCSPGQCAG